MKKAAVMFPLVLLLALSACTHERTTVTPANQTASSAADTTQAINRIPDSESTSQVPQTASPAETPAADNWTIVPGKSVGTITAATTLKEMEHRFGKANVKPGQLPGAEGEMYDGVVIFPNDPQKKLEIGWRDGKGQHPGTVTIEGDKSVWKTEDGIAVGTSLKDLEKLNGGPFAISGFGWDYGGTVFGWGDKGKLKSKYGGNLVLRLNPPENAPEKLANKVMGDNTFQSSNPAMQQLNPKVEQIIVTLN